MATCLTVFADASYDHASGIAAFAGWFRAADRIHRISKVSKRRFASSNQAELEALCAAVLVAVRRQRSFGRGDFVVAKSDSTYAVLHLQNGTGPGSTERRLVAQVHEVLDAHGLRLYVRHVKGHSKGSEPRFYVNRWCDEEARRLLRQAVRRPDGTNSGTSSPATGPAAPPRPARPRKRSRSLPGERAAAGVSRRGGEEPSQG